MRRFAQIVFLTMGLMGLGAAHASPAKDGSTFVGWYVPVDYENWDRYMDFLTKVHRHELDALKKAGYIKDYQFLKTRPKGADDWNFAIVLEYRNWAGLDTPGEVLDDIEAMAVANIPNVKEMKRAKNAWRRVIGYQIYQSVEMK